MRRKIKKMIEIKNLNIKERRKKLIDLIFIKGFQRLELSKISDYDSPKDIHNDCINNLNLPVRMTRLGIDSITYRYKLYMDENPKIKEQMYYDIVEKSTKPGKSAISSKDFYEKYGLSHYHCHMLLSKNILHQYQNDDYQELKFINKLINDSSSMHKIIEISDVVKSKRITLNELCQAHDINFKEYKHLLKQYHLGQTVYNIDEKQYLNFISSESEYLKSHPDFNKQMDKLYGGQILLNDAALYFLYNYNDFLEILKNIFDENYIDHLKELKKSITYNMQYYKINDTIKAKLNESKTEYKRNGARDLSIQNKIQNIIEKDPVLKMVFKDILYLEFNEKIKRISELIKGNAEGAFLLYKEKMGKCDIYPNGHIMKIVTHDFRKKYAFDLERKKLLKIDYTRLKYSKFERKFMSSIPEIFEYNYKINDRKVLRYNSRDFYEIDFYFPDQNIGFELNPCTTHNSNNYRIKHFNDQTKDKFYHFDKFKRSELNNITLIQLFEYDLVSPKFEDITIPKIKRLFNIDLYNIDSLDVEINNITQDKNKVEYLNQFVELNHVLGITNTDYKYEIKYQNEVIGAALFKKLSDTKVELKRLCFKQNYKIIDCISKLIKKVFKDYNNINCIMTYSNNSYETGLEYENSGFKYLGETGPVLVFVNPSHPLDKYSWQITMNLNSDKSVINQDRIKKGLKPYYEEKFNIREYIETELSHRQDRQKGYDAIYTPGSKKWEIYRDDVIK